jgi:hypothetical protein
LKFMVFFINKYFQIKAFFETHFKKVIDFVLQIRET